MNTPSRGFSVIELLVAMTIAAVLMMFAFPAFNDFTDQRRMTTNANAFISAINYARNEATRRGGEVTLQSVDADDSDNEWGLGFCVNAGDPGNCDTPLQIFTIDGSITLDGLGLLNNEEALSFNSRGMLQDGLQGQIQLCGEDADDDPGRVINISAIGRASVLELTCYP